MRHIYCILSVFILTACAMSESQLSHLDDVAKDVPTLSSGKILTRNDVLIKNGNKDEIDIFEPSDKLDKCSGSAEYKERTIDSVTEQRARARIYEDCIKVNTTKPYKYAGLFDWQRKINQQTCACFAVKFTETSKKHWCSRKYIFELSKDKWPNVPKIQRNGYEISLIEDIEEFAGKQCLIDIDEFDKEIKADNKSIKENKAQMKAKLKAIYPQSRKYCETYYAARGTDCECFAYYSYTIQWHNYSEMAKNADRYYLKDKYTAMAEDAANASAMFCTKN